MPKRGATFVKTFLISSFITLFLTVIIACSTSPEGRGQLLLMPAAQVDQMGAQAFSDIKKKTPSSRDSRAVSNVQCVAKLIVKQLDQVDEGAWEVQVFEQGEANAFALPGRKIGVYTGLLKIATTPSQLAAVIGHEVGHVIANHGNERVSIGFLSQLGLVGVQLAIDKGVKDPNYRQIATLLGAGGVYGLTLKFSRDQESEADMIGLNLMARAGFDPRESIQLWQNMARAGGGRQPPEWLSTHPSHSTRIQQLESRMETAMPVYSQSPYRDQASRCTL